MPLVVAVPVLPVTLLPHPIPASAQTYCRYSRPNPNIVVSSYRSFLPLSLSLSVSIALSLPPSRCLCIFYSNYRSFAGIYVTVLTRTPGTVATTTTTKIVEKKKTKNKKDLKQFNTLHDIQILLWEITRVQPLSVVFRQL